MNWHLRFLILLVAFAGWGCQPQKEVIREPAPFNDNKLPDLKSGGGSDTGGENGIGCSATKACAPLESFKENISEKPEYAEFILPIISKLSEVFKPLAADLIHLAAERRWYFVPVELQKLPSRWIGVGFESDQVALHKKHEIWITTLLYDQMTAKNKAIVLLHELVMGVRLMEYQNDLDHCLAKAAINLTYSGGLSDYNYARQVCMHDAGPAPLDPHEIRLDDEDHSNIRDLTMILIDKIDTIQAVELEAWLKSRRFRDYK
jgi:hypothetical protein